MKACGSPCDVGHGWPGGQRRIPPSRLPSGNRSSRTGDQADRWACLATQGLRPLAEADLVRRRDDLLAIRALRRS